MAHSNADEGLSALDPDLPFLASEAAVDIDNLLAQRREDFTAIHRLARRLRNSIESGTAGGPPRSLMDPATLTVLGEAISQSGGTSASPRIADLLAHAEYIANALSHESLSLDKKELERVRDFCIALSDAAAAYRKSIHDLRPSHPFRR